MSTSNVKYSYQLNIFKLIEDEEGFNEVKSLKNIHNEYNNLSYYWLLVDLRKELDRTLLNMERKALKKDFSDNEFLIKSIFIVTGHDGAELHVEKAFMSEERAIAFKKNLEIDCDDSYVFSIIERKLILND